MRTGATKNYQQPSIKKIIVSLVLLIYLCLPWLSQAQQYIPPEWQVSDSTYQKFPWIRDQNANRIDDIIEYFYSPTMDIIVDLNQFVDGDTLINNYMGSFPGLQDDSIYVNDYIPFLILRNFPTDSIAPGLVRRKEVFLIEFAGKFKGNLATAAASMSVIQGCYSPSIADQYPDLSGNNVGIFILDCGVNDIANSGGNPYLPGPRWQADFTINGTSHTVNPGSLNKHATVVALAALGRDAPNDRNGIAPGAQLGDYKVFSDISYIADVPVGDYIDVVAALSEVIDLQISQRKIVNMSFSQINNLTDSEEPLDDDGTEAFSQLVNYAVSRGIVCVASASNNGLDANGNDVFGKISSPGVAFGAITVGSSVTNGDCSRDNHTHCPLSSKGPLVSSSKYRWKPDVVAPGMHHYASPPAGLFFPNSGGSWQETNVVGSSVSTALVSGLAALILEYKSTLTPACLKAALIESAELGAYPSYRPAELKGILWNQYIGNGFVDAFGAFQRLDELDLAIKTIRWESTPVYMDQPNEIVTTVQNLDTKQTAFNVFVDFYICRSGINPHHYAYIGTGRKVSVEPLAEEVVSMNYTPYISDFDGTSVMSVKVELRYGGDTNHANNSAEMNDVHLQSFTEDNSPLTKAGNPPPWKIRRQATVKFDVYNSQKNSIKLAFGSCIKKPSDVDLTFEGYNGIPSSIEVPPVNKPPLRMTAHVSWPIYCKKFEVKISPRYLFSTEEYGSITFYWDPRFNTCTTEVERELSTFVLHKNYPNPFSENTRIHFIPAKEDKYTLEIYNILGQRVRTLFQQKSFTAAQTVTWDARDDLGVKVARGIYFCKLRNERFTKIQKMVLIQ